MKTTLELSDLRPGHNSMAHSSQSTSRSVLCFRHVISNVLNNTHAKYRSHTQHAYPLTGETLLRSDARPQCRMEASAVAFISLPDIKTDVSLDTIFLLQFFISMNKIWPFRHFPNDIFKRILLKEIIWFSVTAYLIEMFQMVSFTISYYWFR